MRWKLADCWIFGGTRPAEGKAPFARGDVVLARGEEARPPFLRVRAYPQDEVEGDELTTDDWQALLSSAQALELKAPTPALAHAALWVFRNGYKDRGAALEDLSREGALAHREPAAGGAWVVIVREDVGNPLRDRLAMEQFERAWREARASRWEDALALADLAFVLSRGLIVERVALLALALDRVGRKTGSEGLLEMASKSRGVEFGRRVREKMEELARQCVERRREEVTRVRSNDDMAALAAAAWRARAMTDIYEKQKLHLKGCRAPSRRSAA
jgi:hypothetical protein